RARLESPADAPVGAVASVQRRDVRPIGEGTRARSDLAGLRLKAENAKRGLSANADLEITAEGETRRTRIPIFVGGGRGSYDAFGNFVGRGDYDLGVSVLPGLQRLSRAALSTRADWNFGTGEMWRGSHLEFSFEGDARRRGEFLLADAVISPGRVLGDPALAQGSVAQRLETDLAPGARFSNMRLRLERRVSGDRSFDNFSQTLEERTGQLRWRARFNTAWSAELEARTRRQEAAQVVAGVGAFRRTLTEQGANSQWIFQPGDRLRASAVVDASWSRPAGQAEFTRTVRAGPEVSVAVGSRGRANFTARHALISGPAVLGLLPSADPAGAARWDGTAHLDIRVRESTTFGLSYSVSERPGIPLRSVGRAELRAFF
ncbi:MAG: hypothetical protein ABIS67_00020, partial [Candidatus Eisenbacteria bacterium]